MFVMGKASPEEIKRMEDMGWDVEEVNIPHFNKCLDPTCGSDSIEHGDDGEVKDYDDEDKMVSVFVDFDMAALLQEWQDDEKAFSESIS
jgi:hypothetical protein